MKIKKIIITGSGKSGTTFLVHLLTALGLDTGYTMDTIEDNISVKSWGGLEWPIRGRKAKDPSPRIIKNPVLCFDLLERAKRWNWEIEHVYVSIRKFNEVASHRYYRNDTHRLFETLTPEQREIEQALVSSLSLEDIIKLEAARGASHIGYLMEQLTDMNIPCTYMKFPRTVKDVEYCRQKLMYLVKDIPKDRFSEVYSSIADADKVHWS